MAALAIGAVAWLATPRDAAAFCGFYVGKADTSLYNRASQVVMVRSGPRTVISMMNDYQGELSEFALVVPVPTVLEKGQVHIGDRELFRHLDAYSAPRLVEYYDADPCQQMKYDRASPMASAPQSEADRKTSAERTRSLGVTIEGEYTVGEYDIVMLSAKQSDGLETWLTENGYRIPSGASRALRPYVEQRMKFFVARVNLQEQKKTGLTLLRPLQFAFESPKFMLPIRLGMVNAHGPQELVLYVLTPNGRVESTNYRTVKLPSGMELPETVKDDFGGFYRAMFDTQVDSQKLGAVFTEYFWNMASCDPCAAEPLSREELRKLGAFWLDDGSMPVMVSRLHVRYTAESFPEDLVLQETSDRESFQGRYVLRHAWRGDRDQCPAAKNYFEDLARRREAEAASLASLTGWPLERVRAKLGLGAPPTLEPWWQRLWN